MKNHDRPDRGGFTLFEIVLSTAIMLVMARFTIEAINGIQSTSTQASVTTRLQQNGQTALMKIVADLNRSGVANSGGRDFPHTFVDGNADPAFDNHDHAPATQHALATEPGAGSSREIVFLQPRDGGVPAVVSDGIPDVDAQGALVWSLDEFSYVLTTIGGVNVLQRRVNTAAPVTLATNVERVLFETAGVTDIAIPTDSVRVRLFMRDIDTDGAIQRYTAEAVVRLRNG